MFYVEHQEQNRSQRKVTKTQKAQRGQRSVNNVTLRFFWLNAPREADFFARKGFAATKCSTWNIFLDEGKFAFAPFLVCVSIGV